MSFAAFCACQQFDLVRRLRVLEVRIHRQRIARERQARLWRLWQAVESGIVH